MSAAVGGTYYAHLEIQKILDTKRVELVSLTRLDTYTKAHLVSQDVVKVEWVRDLEGQRPSEQVSALLDVVRVGSVRQYEGLRAALEVTGQQGVLSLLPVLPETHYQQDSMTSAPPAPDAAAAIASQVQHTSPRLWDPKHPDGGNIITLTPLHLKMMNNFRPNVTESLEMTTTLWNRLRELNVLRTGKMQEIKLKGTDEQQASALLDYLEQRPVWNLHALLRACVLADQEHIVRLMGKDIHDYKES